MLGNLVALLLHKRHSSRGATASDHREGGKKQPANGAATSSTLHRTSSGRISLDGPVSAYPQHVVIVGLLARMPPLAGYLCKYKRKPRCGLISIATVGSIVRARESPLTVTPDDKQLLVLR